VRMLYLIYNGASSISTKIRTISDLTSKKTATNTLVVKIPKPAQTLRLSDIQLGRRIDTAPPDNRMLKNGLWVVPNVTHTLSSQGTTLPFYFEIYGLKEGEKDAFDLAYALLDHQNKPVKVFTSTRYKKPGTTCMKTETLEIPALTPGSYTLKITVRDADTRVITTGEKTFTITNPDQQSLATDPASLQRYYNQIYHIATKSERKQYNTLSPHEKVAFILQFWKDRDPTPNTPENEFAAEHFRRMHYVTQSFPSRPKQHATHTDQGRVYIVYGPPTDIERNPFNAIGKDYQIWTYEHLNYYQFVFLDRLGDSVLELVHATMPEQVIGDPSDPMAPPNDAFGSPSPNTSP
jgi:GWxTD domain-containing protein